jgi:hypothetical protein
MVAILGNSKYTVRVIKQRQRKAMTMSNLTMGKNDAQTYVYMNSPGGDHERAPQVLKMLKANPNWTQEDRDDFIEGFYFFTNGISFQTDLWREIFTYYGPAKKPSKRKKPLTVWRGASNLGLSWTKSFETAQMFARRNSASYFSPDGGDSKIWRGVVNPEAIIFESNRRGESEVVIDFDNADLCVWHEEPIDYTKWYWQFQYASGNEIPDTVIKHYGFKETA